MPVPKRTTTSPAPRATAAPANGMTAPGRLATAAQVSAHRELPKLSPSGAFLLHHHPNSWELATVGLEKPTWLPVVKPYSLEGGRNGNRTVGGGIDYDASKLRLEKQGWIFIPETAPHGPYRYEIDVATGVANLQIWDRVTTYPGGDYDRTFDHEAYNRWRLRLVEDGVVPAPRARVLEKLKGRLARRITRNSANVHIPAVKAKIEAAEDVLGSMASATAPAAQDQEAILAAENARLREQLAAFQAEQERQAAAATEAPPPMPGVIDEDDEEDEDDG